MTPGLLKTVGEALYGERWQAPLARDLDVTDRTMRRWAAGEFEPPPGTRQHLLRLVRARRKSLAAIVRDLSNRGDHD